MLTKLSNIEKRSSARLAAASEALGVRATDAVIDARGEVPLFRGEGSSGSGRVDDIGVNLEELSITVYESKGGTAGLGSATIDGLKYRQGTGPYLQRVLDLDPRIGGALADLIKGSGEQGQALLKAIEDGTITINYDLVRSLPSGKIELSRFDVGNTVPKLPEIPGPADHYR